MTSEISIQDYEQNNEILNFDLVDIKLNQVQSPKDGCYVTGLFLEGCKWSVENQTLAESDPKILYTPMSIIYLLPSIK